MGLAIYVFLAFFYYGDFYRFDRDLLKWNEPEFKEALLTQEFLPLLISAHQKRIEEGDVPPSLEQLKREIFGG